MLAAGSAGATARPLGCLPLRLPRALARPPAVARALAPPPPTARPEAPGPSGATSARSHAAAAAGSRSRAPRSDGVSRSSSRAREAIGSRRLAHPVRRAAPRPTGTASHRRCRRSAVPHGVEHGDGLDHGVVRVQGVGRRRAAAIRGSDAIGKPRRSDRRVVERLVAAGAGARDRAAAQVDQRALSGALEISAENVRRPSLPARRRVLDASPGPSPNRLPSLQQLPEPLRISGPEPVIAALNRPARRRRASTRRRALRRGATVWGDTSGGRCRDTSIGIRNGRVPEVLRPDVRGGPVVPVLTSARLDPPRQLG